MRRSGAARRNVTISFRLPARGRVRFVVTELSPVCRRIGSFAVAGRPGINRVRFRGRVGKRRLEPGTYRLDARRGALALFGVRVVVARNRVIRPAGLARTSLGDACGTSTAFTAAAAREAARSELAALASPQPAPLGAAGSPASPFQPAPAKSEPNHAGQALGAQFTHTDAGGWSLATTLVLVAVAVAIALLTTAAVPNTIIPDPRVELFLVRRRTEIALAGVSILFLAVVAYLVWVA